MSGGQEIPAGLCGNYRRENLKRKWRIKCLRHLFSVGAVSIGSEETVTINQLAELTVGLKDRN
jgi:hypothetical protein